MCDGLPKLCLGENLNRGLETDVYLQNWLLPDRTDDLTQKQIQNLLLKKCID